uniref:Uncharacterized protein n=1 Tax=Fusarium solani partitivirus 3 TaxID=3237256 RepID=A0AB39A6I9_9VIRU
MDFKPSRDYLTLRQYPPQFCSNNCSNLAFAIICSPTTYGTPLYMEMQAKNQASEYVTVRNAAILRRECLRLDFLNPVVANRIEYLRAVKLTVSHFSQFYSATRIARGFVNMLVQHLDKYQNRLTQHLLLIETVQEYQDQFGKRLSYLLSFNTTDDDSHKQLSMYESLLRDISQLVSSRPPILKYLLLNTDFFSVIITLTNDDRETRFFPTLTARERAIIRANLTNLGEDDSPGVLSPEDDSAIRPLWPSSITISRHGNDDYFRQRSTDEFDKFGHVTDPATKTVTDIAPVDNGDRGYLLNLLHQSKSETPSPTTETHTLQTPPSISAGTWTKPLQLNNENESSNTMAKSPDNRTSNPNSPLSVTFSNRGDSDALHTQPQTWKTSNASHNVRRIRFSNKHCDLTFIRASASMSPERQTLGDVTHVSFLPNANARQPLFELFIKRFDIRMDGSIDLYLTKQAKFKLILENQKAIKLIRCELTTGSTKESKELTPETSDLWFVTAMD